MVPTLNGRSKGTIFLFETPPPNPDSLAAAKFDHCFIYVPLFGEDTTAHQAVRARMTYNTMFISYNKNAKWLPLAVELFVTCDSEAKELTLVLKVTHFRYARSYTRKIKRSDFKDFGNGMLQQCSV